MEKKSKGYLKIPPGCSCSKDKINQTTENFKTISILQQLFSSLHGFSLDTRVECLVTLHMAILHIDCKETGNLTRKKSGFLYKIPLRGSPQDPSCPAESILLHYQHLTITLASKATGELLERSDPASLLYFDSHN